MDVAKSCRCHTWSAVTNFIDFHWCGRRYFGIRHRNNEGMFFYIFPKISEKPITSSILRNWFIKVRKTPKYDKKFHWCWYSRIRHWYFHIHEHSWIFVNLLNQRNFVHFAVRPTLHNLCNTSYICSHYIQPWYSMWLTAVRMIHTFSPTFTESYFFDFWPWNLKLRNSDDVIDSIRDYRKSDAWNCQTQNFILRNDDVMLFRNSKYVVNSLSLFLCWGFGAGVWSSLYWL